MKTPKEKAKELVGKFKVSGNIKLAKICALICIDEKIESHNKLGELLYEKQGTDSYMERCINYDLTKELEEVKQEIEKL